MRLHGWREYQSSLTQRQIIKRADFDRWAREANRRRFVRRVVAICGAVLFVVGLVLLARRGWR